LRNSPFLPSGTPRDLRVERIDLRLELALRLHGVLACDVADAHRRQARERLRRHDRRHQRRDADDDQRANFMRLPRFSR
jgi:hypothetical protein